MPNAGKFAGKTVVVAGATGVVGSGAVRRYLDAGATVVGISRSAEKLEGLRKRFSIGATEPFIPVVGDFTTEAEGQAAAREVARVLDGKPIDHFVAAIGFVTVDGPASAVSIDTFRKSLDDGLFNNFIAAKSFIPAMKSRPGATYTFVSGGFAHGVFAPQFWLATVKNASVNNLALAFAAETANDAIRVNSACVHVGVNYPGLEKNQLGMPATRDTLSLGNAFLGLASSDSKGAIVCFKEWSDVDAWAARA